jgi:nitrate reductase NapD
MNEIHIAGCVVRVPAERLGEAAAAIGELPRCEVFAQSPVGKLVVVLEGNETAQIMDSIDAIRNIKGVQSVEFAYQHVEDETAMKEIVPCR